MWKYNDDQSHEYRSRINSRNVLHVKYTSDIPNAQHNTGNVYWNISKSTFVVFQTKKKKQKGDLIRLLLRIYLFFSK
jgi:hypothetical protein